MKGAPKGYWIEIQNFWISTYRIEQVFFQGDPMLEHLLAFKLNPDLKWDLYIRSVSKDIEKKWLAPCFTPLSTCRIIFIFLDQVLMNEQQQPVALSVWFLFFYYFFFFSFLLLSFGYAHVEQPDEKLYKHPNWEEKKQSLSYAHQKKIHVRRKSPKPHTHPRADIYWGSPERNKQ